MYAQPDGNAQLRALRELYEATDGDNWTNHQNWPSGDAAWRAVRSVSECQNWYGLSLVAGKLHVINLGSNNLRGTLPASLGELPDLEYLYLMHNQLRGPVPASLGELARLDHLFLSHNQLTGAIPPSLGQLPVRRLGLDNNQLTGAIPSALGQLARLTHLYLNHNQLMGPLPAVLTQCTGLEVLYLSANRLTGEVPVEFGQLVSLQELGLNSNQFTGSILQSLTSLPLAALYLHENQLTGLPGWVGAASVPGNFYVHANELDFADLETNFTGPSQPVQPNFYYSPQASPAGTDTIRYELGGPLWLTRTPGGAHNVYQWEQQVGGQWQAVPGQTQTTLRLATADAAAAGYYRLRVTNTWVPDLTLFTKLFYALGEAPPALVNPPTAPCAVVLAPAPVLPDRSAEQDLVNYVRTYAARTTLTEPDQLLAGPKEQVQVTTQYLDGLGRPTQTVQRQASPTGRDLVQAIEYDALGRQPKQFLPYAATSPPDAAGYRPDARREQDQFYRATEPGPGQPYDGVARTGVAYGETSFEASPLNRVREQASPGESWALGQPHTVKRGERPNTSDDAVPRWTASYGTTAAEANGLTYQGPYPAGELWLTQTTDEQGHPVREFQDKQGLVVVKQVELTPGQWLTTQYVYDDFQRLRAVLPPKATQLLGGGGSQQQVTPAVDSLLFRYRYDGRGRVLAKQVPGQDGEVQLVYDQLDRAILTQDAQQRTRQEWSWSKYDALGRVILTGLVTHAGTAEQLQLQAEQLSLAQWEEPTTAEVTHYYSTTGSYPRLGQDGFTSAQVLTISYYDNYNFNHDAQGTPDAAFDNRYAAQFPSGQTPTADEQRVTGQLTRTKTRVLGVAETEPGAWLTTTTFFDERARPIQVVSTNARGGQDIVTTQLDFTGQVLKSYSVHTGPNHEAIPVTETFAYDHVGRLLETRQQLPGDAEPVLVASHRYNEVGQLLQKTMAPGTALAQQVDYAYNARGWLTGLNQDLVTGATSADLSTDLWGMQLSYDCGFLVPQYNGNISGQQWRSKSDGVARAYGYLYDGANRLTQGDFVARDATTQQWTSEQQRFGLLGMRYDANGNIQALQRRGLLAQATRTVPRRFGATDELSYSYQGNRLVAVEDAVTGNALPQPAGAAGALTSLAGDFQEKSRNAQTAEYGYDANGNLTKDANKGITDITYNHLNLPAQIRFSAQDYIEFRYSAAGQKVAKLVYQAGQPVVRTDYLGAYQYEGDSLRFFPHAEGRVLRFVSPVSGQTRYEREYTLKDHLGNLRIAYRLGTPAWSPAGPRRRRRSGTSRV